LDPLSPRPVLLVVPDEPIATDWAYGVLVTHRAGKGAVQEGSPPLPTSEASWSEIESSARNDFEEALFLLRPELAKIKANLEDAGARPALLSGSGSAVFGVFDSEARVIAAEAELDDLTIEARILRTRTRG
jgi:4-diphosphocytidyl-2-C-methyl-D-erythritol kinase